jgi:lysophospholipase L1-like esterase
MAQIVSVLPAGLAMAQMTKSLPLLKITCMGDSTTYGSGLEDEQQRMQWCYPAKLQSILNNDREMKSKFRFSCLNCGRSGVTASVESGHFYGHTEQFARALDNAAHYHVLLLGVNDAKESVAADAQAVESGLARILKHVRGTCHAFEVETTIMLVVPRVNSGGQLSGFLRDHVEAALTRIATSRSEH